MDHLSPLLRRLWTDTGQPHSSPAAAKGLGRLLPLSSLPEAREALGQALSSFNVGSGPFRPRDFLILAELSRAAVNVIAALTTSYLGYAKALRRGAHAGWGDAVEIVSQITHAYAQLARDIHEGVADRALERHRASVTAAALHYAAIQAKWYYFRESEVPAEHWERINRLYANAEEDGIATTETTIATGGATSCAAEYARILALDLLKPQALPAWDVESLFRWLAGIDAPDLWPESHSDIHTHCVDLLQPTGPQSLVHTFAQGAGVRYFSSAELVEQAAREEPDPRLAALLQQASVIWARGLSQRWLSRTARPQGLEVVRGVAAVRRVLRGKVPEIAAIEHWIVRDTSAGGLGAVAPQLVEAGEVLGLRGTAGRWEVAVVRWVRDREIGVHVGVEYWSHAPRDARLAIASEGERTLPDAYRLGCIFLPGTGRKGVSSTLLVPTGLARTCALADLYDRDFIYRIRIAATLSRHGNWARARFDVLSRRRASH